MSTVLYERTPPIARVIINRPEAMNAFDLATARELAARLHEFDKDDALRVAILTGAGDKAFCAGADLKKMHGGSHEGGIAELWDDERQVRRGQKRLGAEALLPPLDRLCLGWRLQLALRLPHPPPSPHAPLHRPG